METFKPLGQFGGVLLAFGILALGVIGFKPGWAAIGGLLPDPNLILFCGFGLVIAGAVFIVVETMIGLWSTHEASHDFSIDAHPGENKLKQLLSDFWGKVRSAKAAVKSTPNQPAASHTKSPKPGAQRRVCLKPVWPQRQTSHWVGGLPCLPAGTQWPNINDKPASFIAQIALNEMPDTLWNGAGPRTGWFVFFGDGDTDCDVVVLHVEGEVEPRAQPEWAKYNWDLNSSVEGMAHVLGTTADVPSKWFIEIVDQTTFGSVEDMSAEVTTQEGWDLKFWDDEKGRWIWENVELLNRRHVTSMITQEHLRNGTTWTTPFAIIAALKVSLKENSGKAKRSNAGMYTLQERLEKELTDLSSIALGTDKEATTAQTKMNARHAQFERQKKSYLEDQLAFQMVADRLQELLEMEANFRDASETIDYDPSFGAELHAFIQSSQIEIKTQTNRTIHLLGDTFSQVMEHQARHAYVNDPSTVPHDLFECCAPLWQQECETTAIFLGTDSDLPNEDMRLLDMPPNPLTGITIGDHSRFFSDISVKDLANGLYSNARASNTHG